MSANPRVSVVMSVYNGADTLRDSVRSVLTQEGVDFEFIVVDDGSTDDSGALLDEFANKDHRLRVIHQENRGLTRALIRGCAAARGTFIARQDCGDLSLPGRLSAELRVIETHPDAALVSCGVRYVGPRQELLYEVSIPDEDATDGLLALDLAQLRGPAHHGSALFRRDLYDRVGGYREQFYFAQDLDLWTRLVEHGRHIASPTILYQATFALGSISSLQRRRQIQCTHLIFECCRLRRSGMSQTDAIEKARAIAPDAERAAPAEVAAALYFVGSCLHKRSDPRAKEYFRRALRAYPLHLKSAMRLVIG